MFYIRIIPATRINHLSYHHHPKYALHIIKSFN